MRQMKKRMALWLIVAVVFGMVSALWAEEGHKININQAPAEELIQLHRVGPKYAQRIVEYREAHGPFAEPRDIMNVPGLGERVYEINKERISVE